MENKTATCGLLGGRQGRRPSCSSNKTGGSEHDALRGSREIHPGAVTFQFPWSWYLHSSRRCSFLQYLQFLEMVQTCKFNSSNVLDGQTRPQCLAHRRCSLKGGVKGPIGTASCHGQLPCRLVDVAPLTGPWLLAPAILLASSVFPFPLLHSAEHSANV